MRALGRVALAAASIASLALGSAALSVTPAHAAGELDVSLDGATFSSGVAAPLFSDIARMIPGDAQQGTVFVRNSGADAGFLRVVVGDVTYTDLDFANELTLQAI